jgi:serine phosphatase RsbU (regulator of sigma subunit)/predicted ester cyclase
VSSEDENKALVRRFLKAFANADLGTLDELLAPEFINHSLLPGQDPGREGYIQSAAEQHAGFSDIQYIIEYQATDGDMVITRLTMRAIHDRGSVFGVGPTGRDWLFTNIVIDRVCEGKIVEEWSADTISPFLETLRQEIRERERVEQELRVARIIQEASLPKEVPQLEGWEISPLYRPAREVGGDFYDFFELEDGRVGVVVGDATGKGVPAALVVTATYSMLRAVAQALGSLSPGEVLAQVNETLVARIPQNMFVTCFYAILEPKSGHLLYANAGHTLPCRKRRSDDQAEELSARGMPLGLMSGMSYEEKATILVPGDVVLFCSDGLVEAHDPRGEMFGSPRLRGFLSERSDSGRGLGAALMEELESFTGEGWEQEDDITLLTLRRSPTPG